MISETAKALFIHRNTLIYRIDKIKSILGRDLKDSEERLLLQLGLRVYQVRQIREAAANS
jgi:purine catabolism regulator